MSDKKFIPGLSAKAPHPNAPDFVKASLFIKVKDLGNFLREQNKAGEEWVNAQVKESRGGKYYVELDDWKPDGNRGNSDDDDDVPF